MLQKKVILFIFLVAFSEQSVTTDTDIPCPKNPKPKTPPIVFQCGDNAACNGTPSEPIEADNIYDSFKPKSQIITSTGFSVEARENQHLNTEINTKWDSFPYVLALLKDREIVCSGILISNKHVLTAAHCTCGKKPNSAFIGKHVINHLNEGLGHYFQLTEKYTYFDNGIKFCELGAATKDNNLTDLAVIEIDKPYELINQQFIMPLNHIGGNTSNNKSIAIGYGASEYSHVGGQKRNVDINFQDCTELESVKSNCIPHKEYISINTQGDWKDTCNGDSGGALVSIVNNKLILIGLVSRKISDGKEECGSGGIYVKLDSPIIRHVLASLNI